jgi:hypothetical protein
MIVNSNMWKSTVLCITSENVNAGGTVGQETVPEFTWKLSNATLTAAGALESFVPRSRLNRVGTVATVSEPSGIQPPPLLKNPVIVEPFRTSRSWPAVSVVEALAVLPGPSAYSSGFELNLFMPTPPRS